jgi:hypothetical protein
LAGGVTAVPPMFASKYREINLIHKWMGIPAQFSPPASFLDMRCTT